MTNYNYNGMNAQDIANNIIAKEEAYLTIDYDALSLEEKCDYAIHHTGIYHPLFRQGKDIKVLMETLIPELHSRAERGDWNAMYYLSVFHPDVTHRSNEHRAMVEHAMEEGSYEAQIYYASWFCRDDEAKAYDLLDEVLKFYSLEDVSEKDKKNLYDCYCMLTRIGQTSDEREHYKKLADDLALKFVLDGEYHSLSHLCMKNHCPKDPVTKQYVFDDETVFWKTVSFLVESHFYDKWGKTSDHLGICLLRGIGCEEDPQKAKRIYLDLYFRKPFDRSKMKELLNIDEDASFADAECAFEKEIEDGSIEGYWKLILLGILKNDAKAVEQICNEAIAKHPGELLKIMPMAYTKLLCVSNK